jgi:hypothetical protein
MIYLDIDDVLEIHDDLIRQSGGSAGVATVAGWTRRSPSRK